MLEAALRSALLSDAPFYSLVSDRVYPVRAPQDVNFPYVVYSIISGPRDYTQDGPDGVTTFRLQYDVYAATYSDCVSAAYAMISRLSGLHGSFGSPPLVIQRVFVDDESSAYDASIDNQDRPVYRKRVDVIVTAEIG